jgi:hypothetical protein
VAVVSKHPNEKTCLLFVCLFVFVVLCYREKIIVIIMLLQVRFFLVIHTYPLICFFLLAKL